MANPVDQNWTDEDLLALKAGRPRSTPGGGDSGGGGGPGGGFGGAFGGGGSGFLGSDRAAPLGTAYGAGMMMPKRKPYAQGANGAIPLSYTPTKDTVPAMLSPGEYVMNNRAMQLPGMNNFMSALNAVGNGGYAEGGMVLDPEMLVKILSMLAQFVGDGGTEGGGHMDADGGQPQHFAWGGMVGQQQGGFQRPRMPVAAPQRGGMGSMPGGGAAAPAGSGGRFGAGSFQGTGWNTSPTIQLPSQPPSQPPAVPQQPGVLPTGPSDMGSLYKLLAQYGQTGAFGPEGDPRIMRMVQDQATSNADAMRARSANMGALAGLDPGQAGAYKMQADLRGQGDVANALNSAQYGQLANQQQFGQQLFGNLAGLNMDEYRKWLDYQHQQQLGG